jgi:6-phosphogluconate dehydrogenase
LEQLGRTGEYTRACSYYAINFL